MIDGTTTIQLLYLCLLYSTQDIGLSSTNRLYGDNNACTIQKLIAKMHNERESERERREGRKVNKFADISNYAGGVLSEAKSRRGCQLNHYSDFVPLLSKKFLSKK